MTAWVEANLHHKLADDRPLILALHGSVVKQVTGLVSWHYFREPEIRLRLEVTDDAEAGRIEEKIRQFVDARRSEFQIDRLVFGRHGKEGEKYDGEPEAMGKEGFEVHKMIWMWQSELAVLRFRQETEGRLERQREEDLDRLWHLAANQLKPVPEIDYHIDLGGFVLSEAKVVLTKKREE